MTTPPLPALLAEARELLAEQALIDKCRDVDLLELSVDRRLAAKVPLLVERLEAVETAMRLYREGAAPDAILHTLSRALDDPLPTPPVPPPPRTLGPSGGV